MRRSVLLTLACASLLSACGDDPNETGPAPVPTTTTAAAAPPLPLAPTLDALRSGEGDVYCDLNTVRLLHDNYGRPAPAGLRLCKAGAGDAGRQGVDVEVVSRGAERAIVKLDVRDYSVHFALVSDEERWLIDDIGDPEDPGFPYRRQPAVTEGVSAEELEGFIRELAPQTTRIDCEAVEHQNLGEWECAVTVVKPGKRPAKGSALVTVASDGSVEAGSFGSPLSVGGCCMDLRSD